MQEREELMRRFRAVRQEAKNMRSSLYHLTNNMRIAAKCCTSGECGNCRDSQAVISWILVNAKRVMQVPDGLRIWTEVAESYFSQFVWSRYHPRNKKSINSSGVA
ncbi:hypothetical protein D3C85_975900 [compost metagenome]